MGVYTKKPLRVEAYQLDVTILDWLVHQCNGEIKGLELSSNQRFISFKNKLGATTHLYMGDWLILDNGQAYSCSNEHFLLLYEEVS